MSMFEYVEYGVGGNKYQKHIRVHKWTTKTYRYSIYTYNIENKTWNIAQFWKMLECQAATVRERKKGGDRGNAGFSVSFLVLHYLSKMTKAICNIQYSLHMLFGPAGPDILGISYISLHEKKNISYVICMPGWLYLVWNHTYTYNSSYYIHL